MGTMEQTKDIAGGVTPASAPGAPGAAKPHSSKGYTLPARKVEKPDIASVLNRMEHVASSLAPGEECLAASFTTLIEALKSERGFVLLRDRGADEFKAIIGHGVELEYLFSAGEISQTILRAVYEDETPLLTTDAMEDPRFAVKISVLVAGIRSVMCAPLMTERGIFGLIYVDNRFKKGFFCDEDLDYLEECAKKFSLIAEKSLTDLVYKS